MPTIHFHHRLMLPRSMCGAQDKPSASIGGDRVKTIECSAVRQIGGHRSATGIKTAKKSCDELQARRIGQHNSLTAKPFFLQAGSHGASAPIELGIGPSCVAGLAIEQEYECWLIGASCCLLTQKPHEVTGRLLLAIPAVLPRECAGSWVRLFMDKP